VLDVLIAGRERDRVGEGESVTVLDFDAVRVADGICVFEMDSVGESVF
jgi:hypothetical protein